MTEKLHLNENSASAENDVAPPDKGHESGAVGAGIPMIGHEQRKIDDDHYNVVCDLIDGDDPKIAPDVLLAMDGLNPEVASDWHTARIFGHLDQEHGLLHVPETIWCYPVLDDSAAFHLDPMVPVAHNIEKVTAQGKTVTCIKIQLRVVDVVDDIDAPGAR